MPATQMASDLHSRMRHLINSSSSSQEEMIEGSRVAAIAAAEAAAKARVTAMEKAVAATSARAASRRALDLLDSVSRTRARRGSGGVKKRGKSKHVAVKNLYRNEGQMEIHEAEADKKQHSVRGKVVISDGISVCNKASPADHEEEATLIHRESKDKSEEGLMRGVGKRC